MCLQDELSEALLCFGANSTSVDEEDGCESSDEVMILVCVCVCIMFEVLKDEIMID